MRYVYDLCLGGNTYYDGLHDAYVAFTRPKSVIMATTGRGVVEGVY